MLHPSRTTEGENRLYLEEDVSELKFALLLKTLGLTLAQIKGVLASPNRTSVAHTLLKDQRRQLTENIALKHPASKPERRHRGHQPQP